MTAIDLEAAHALVVRTAVADPQGDIQYYMGEFNMTNPRNYHSTQLSGLVITELLGELIDNHFDAASFWLVANNWDNEGDHGFISRNQPGIPDYTPYPAYYPYYFYTRNFGDLYLASSSSDPEIAVYASRFRSGEVGLIGVNETGLDRTANISLSGFSTSGPVNSWVLSGADLAATAVTLNGVGNGLTHGGPAPADVTPYYQEVGVTSSISVNLARYSATSLLIY